jgi:PAS domain S-box-containing protein
MKQEPVEILIVDDHPENLVALRAVLSRPDYHIVEASSGAEALKAVLVHDFALILLDVGMPEMDGFETARFIRSRAASRHVPIIFLTATCPDAESIHKGYAIGAVDYLVKPLDPDIVTAKVAVFVDLFRMKRQICKQEERMREAERLRGEEALRESEALYALTFNKAAVGISHTAPDGRWLWVNDKFCEILGYTREEIVRFRFQDITHPADVEQDLNAVRRMLGHEADTWRREKRYWHKNGGVVWVDLTAAIVRTLSGEGKHFISVIEDITERKLGEERQRFLAAASEQLLSALDYKTTLGRVARLAVERISDGCVIDVRFDDVLPRVVAVAHANDEKSARLAELSSLLTSDRNRDLADAISSRTSKLLTDVSATTAPPLGDPRATALCRELGFRSLILSPILAHDRLLGTIVLGTEGAERPFGQADLATVDDFAHRVAFAFENARLYREARDAVGARDDFLAIASHELKTPLTPLVMYLQRLLANRTRNPLDEGRQQATLARCAKQVERLTVLVDNLLDVSRITSGRLRLELEDFDLYEVIRDVVGRFGEQSDLAGSVVEVVGRSVRGRWDRLRLEQVITNLLGNALKYGAKKPVILQIEADASAVKVVVHDHGIGIEPDKMNHIFDRFARAVSSRSYGGLGLGLYIARQIVEAHEGAIRVSSTPGEGSIFTVELPLRTREKTESQVDEGKGSDSFFRPDRAFN